MDIAVVEKIEHLKKELNKAFNIDEDELAQEIMAKGFKCQQCAKCCKAEYGDNTVTVFPSEIRKICRKTRQRIEDIAVPTPSKDIDHNGNAHTFEWVLRKNGDCHFLKNGSCVIYETRPHICMTYPFFLIGGQLSVCECEGIGKPVSFIEGRDIAKKLKERLILEITESISLFERFRGFQPSGNGNICVHDSEGEHWISVPQIQMSEI